MRGKQSFPSLFMNSHQRVSLKSPFVNMLVQRSFQSGLKWCHNIIPTYLIFKVKMKVIANIREVFRIKVTKASGASWSYSCDSKFSFTVGTATYRERLGDPTWIDNLNNQNDEDKQRITITTNQRHTTHNNRNKKNKNNSTRRRRKKKRKKEEERGEELKEELKKQEVPKKEKKKTKRNRRKRRRRRKNKDKEQQQTRAAMRTATRPDQQ